jgi:hypothetical protein
VASSGVVLPTTAFFSGESSVQKRRQRASSSSNERPAVFWNSAITSASLRDFDIVAFKRSSSRGSARSK